MKTISKRELNQQTAQVLAAVDAGESVVITERGVPRWRIDAFESAAETDAVEWLRAQGRFAPAKKHPTPWPEVEGNPRYSPAAVDKLYVEMREDG